MKRTPLEIKKQQFNKSLRGFDPDEVQSFLSLLSNEWENLITENRQLKKKTTRLSDKLKHYKHVEEALQETLLTARTSSEKKIVAAAHEADIIRARARSEADQIVENANKYHQDARQQILQLIDKRNEMIQTLREFSDQTASFLDSFSAQYSELFTEPPVNDTPVRPETVPGDPYPEDISERIPGTEFIDDILDQLD